MVVSTRKTLAIRTTAIPGLLLVDVPVHGDNRGWFKENWQRSKMEAIGLPDFRPVQNNVSNNASVGTTRGIHAEPWDKFVSVAHGRVFAAWVDLRDGPTFGATFTIEIDESIAVYVPRGVGNSYQTLEPNTAYTYLVNAHWSADAQEEYRFLNMADPTANIAWPISLSDAEVSDKDKSHPVLADVRPMKPRAIVILGANGQVGSALQREFPDATALTKSDFDVTDPKAYADFDWSGVEVLINAAAYTKVDASESDGRSAAWSINVSAAALMATAAKENDLTLVHLSSDYVFDGVQEEHPEDEPVAPIGVYGQTKAAADALVSTVSKHFVVRTSWVIGDGANFVRTMFTLAQKGVDPAVVDDQIGQLTFASELARAIKHLVTERPAYGIYNVTNAGEPTTWFDVARAVFAEAGHSDQRVSPVSTVDYSVGKELAPRPANSVLPLGKIRATGFEPLPAVHVLREYVNNLS